MKNKSGKPFTGKETLLKTKFDLDVSEHETGPHHGNTIKKKSTNRRKRNIGRS